MLLYAISRSNWKPELAEVRPLFKAPRKDGSWFRAELDSPAHAGQFNHPPSTKDEKQKI
jgi:hypothetical protein